MRVNGTAVLNFRKIFASNKFLALLKKVTDPRQLVEEFKDALTHKNFDTTFSHYLIKTSSGRAAIDSAIVAVTDSKIEEAVEFKGVFDEKKNNKRKKVFLCECDDPFNPSHGLFIADECKHYDMCLGCRKSVVTKEHIPYICLRILQFENFRIISPKDWGLMYEDRMMIALDALSKYEENSAKGSEVVKNGWEKAKNGEVSLPPILNMAN